MIYNNFSHGDSEIWKLRIELVKYFIRYASENGHLEVISNRGQPRRLVIGCSLC